MTLLVSYQDVNIYDRDARLFNDGEWLNDTCISFCFRCLEQELKAFKLVDPSIVSFLRLQVEDEDEFEELAQGLKVTKYEWLVLPINDNSSFSSASTHWSLMLCHISSGSVFALDSCNGYNNGSARSLLPKLSRLLKRWSFLLHS
jgi:hypothetical protein